MNQQALANFCLLNFFCCHSGEQLTVFFFSQILLCICFTCWKCEQTSFRQYILHPTWSFVNFLRTHLFNLFLAIWEERQNIFFYHPQKMKMSASQNFFLIQQIQKPGRLLLEAESGFEAPLKMPFFIQDRSESTSSKIDCLKNVEEFIEKRFVNTIV